MELKALIIFLLPYIKNGIELIGLSIIVFGVIKAIIDFIKYRFDFNAKQVKLDLLTAIALALEFFLAAEAISTIHFSGWIDLVQIAAILVIRIIITFVLHWELQNSEDDDEGKLVYKDKSALGNDTKESES